MASFVNDAARENKLGASVLESECAEFEVGGRTSGALLQELDEAIMALDISRATALANAYLQSGVGRKAYQAAVALAARRFQDDPHNQKITISSFEEYAHNSTK
jgi:tagatose-1,6-bisphosphate aldolase